jgi:3-oxoacyl-[acyl-carrier protein] reductase
MDLGLRGKAALVTAASKGMGKACAMGLAAEGARVLISARTEGDVRAAADEIRAKTGAEVIGMAADVTRPEDIKAMGDRARQAFGGADILVANSGGPPRGGFEQMSDAQWHEALDISLLSMVRLIREVLPGMKDRRWGRILTIQSTSVKQPVEGLLLSNAIRPGVAGLAKTLAPELGQHNVTINVVCPGRILTQRLLGGVRASGLSEAEYIKSAGADAALGRVGTPEEFANAVTFLASERASYITGVVLQVDGGLVRGIL